ncbi:MAG: hypothetical protein ACLQLC_21360 [Candidatus Sulfotelmatobacter sp.]
MGFELVVKFGLCAALEWEIPSALLMAGSSLRLKNGYVQDDIVDVGDYSP